MNITHAEVAKELVEDTSRYDAFADEYGGDVRLYKKLRSAVPSEIKSFDDYVQFFALFLERGPTQEVKSDLEQTLARGLKNMVLGDSKAGKTYPVHTLAEISERLDRFRSLSNTLRLPTEYEVAETIVEHTYDDDAHDRYSYEIFSSLLADRDGASPEAVEFVARARLLAGTRRNQPNEAQTRREIARYFESVSDPLPDEQRDTDELLDDISSRPISDQEIPALYFAAAYRSRRPELLYNALYAEGRDVVERYRHRDRRQPSRAELLVAERQLTFVSTGGIADWDTDQQAYVESYAAVARGIRAAGGRWVSGRDRGRWPAPDFETAIEAYASAATAIRNVDDRRYIKYVSKSIRHVDHAIEDWQCRRELNGYAIVMFADLKQRAEFATDVDSVIDGAIAYHNFRKAVTQAHLAFEHGTMSEVLTAVEEATERRDIIPQEMASHTDLELLAQLASARLTEQDGNLEQAETQYSLIEIRDHRVEARLDLLAIKRALKEGDDATALSNAREHYGEDALVTAAVSGATNTEFSADAWLNETSISLPAVNEDAASVIPALLLLYSKAPPIRESLQPLLRQAVLEL